MLRRPLATVQLLLRSWGKVMPIPVICSRKFEHSSPPVTALRCKILQAHEEAGAGIVTTISSRIAQGKGGLAQCPAMAVLLPPSKAY